MRFRRRVEERRVDLDGVGRTNTELPQTSRVSRNAPLLQATVVLAFVREHALKWNRPAMSSDIGRIKHLLSHYLAVHETVRKTSGEKPASISRAVLRTTQATIKTARDFILFRGDASYKRLSVHRGMLGSSWRGPSAAFGSVRTSCGSSSRLQRRHPGWRPPADSSGFRRWT